MYNKKRIGDIYITNEGYTAEVVGAGSVQGYCTIEIEGKQWEVHVGQLRKGQVKNPWHPSVCGIGYVGSSDRDITKINGDAYMVWTNMMQRCYSTSYLERNPTFKDCVVADEWHSFTNFLTWYNDNVKVKIKGVKFHLDKDLLVVGNKTHSPDTCIFIPATVNSFMANEHRNNNSGYVGVSYHASRGVYIASINIFKLDGKLPIRRHLGSFKTPEEASKMYKKIRHNQAQKVIRYMRELGYKPEVYNNIR